MRNRSQGRLVMEAALVGYVDAAKRELRVQAWGDRRVEAAWQGLSMRLGRKDEQRPVRLGWMWAAAALAGGAVLLTLTLTLAGGTRPQALAPSDAATLPQPQRIELGDDAEVRVEPGARLDVVERTTERIIVALHAGSARFQVKHDPRRLIRVQAGAVAVEDLGTTFEVEHRGPTVRVSVTEGSVSVSFPEPAGEGRRSVTLDAGKSATFPAEASFEQPPAPAALPSKAEAARQSAAPAAGWRELARAGKHGGAYQLLAPRDFLDVRDEPGDLLLASDAARLSRHPAEAVRLLRKLLAGHARDPRAPSAAFTLGWLLMNELDRPREAASAFARAEALAPRGNLAEDALARAVEAWYRAGDLPRASTEVERYRKGYPSGRHLAMLERLVGAP